MKLTNKEFCARLRKAKKLAVRDYPYFLCIYDACKEAKIPLYKRAFFDVGSSTHWVLGAKSKEDIAAVFDNSIRNLGEEP